MNDDEGGGGGGLALLVGVSVAAHVMMFGALGRVGPSAGERARRRPPVQVTMEVAPPRPSPSPPAEKAPPPTPKPLLHRVVARAPAEAPPPAAPPEAEAPADFSGVTLTNDGPGPGGWASAVGNGASMRGPIGRPGAKAPRSTAPSERPDGLPVVALGSLSRPPAPPDLADVLERHYPEGARRQGLAGEAVLKARITPDGRARDLVLVSQTAGAFGDACRATLRESVWTAPLDREGRAVATLVTYTCRFEVH